MNMEQGPSPEEINPHRYSNGAIDFNYENAPESGQVEIIKKIIDNVAPYIADKVKIKLKRMAKHNAGFCSRLNLEFKTEQDADSISINPDYEDPSQIAGYTLHEIGHSLEDRLHKQGAEIGKEVLPVGLDEDYGDFYADLLAYYVLDPEGLKARAADERTKNTIAIFEQHFDGNVFDQLRRELAPILERLAAEHRAQKENIKDSDEQADGVQEPFYTRVLHYIEELNKG